MNIKERTKIKKGRLNTITCAIHFSLMASLDTASPQCNVRISNGTLGKPPAAGKNSSAVPLVGRLEVVVVVIVICYYLVFFTCKGKKLDVIQQHAQRYRSIYKKESHTQTNNMHVKRKATHLHL